MQREAIVTREVECVAARDVVDDHVALVARTRGAGTARACASSQTSSPVTEPDWDGLDERFSPESRVARTS